VRDIPTPRISSRSVACRSRPNMSCRRSSRLSSSGVGILFRAYQLLAPKCWGHIRKKMSVPVDKRAILTHCTTSTSEKETTVRCLPVPVICAKEDQSALSMKMKSFHLISAFVFPASLRTQQRVCEATNSRFSLHCSPIHFPYQILNSLQPSGACKF
jgi:hypothetical protein